MKKLLIAIVGIGFVAGVYIFIAPPTSPVEKGGITMPTLTKNQLQTILDAQLATYEADGFTLTSKDGSYTLTAKDEQKVRAFLVKKLDEVLPDEYAPLMSELKTAMTQSNESLLTGMEFELKVIEDDQSAKLEVVLKKLPDLFKAELAKSPQDQQTIQTLLDKGSLAYILWLDNKGDFRGVALKDFSENWVKDNQKISLSYTGVSEVHEGDYQKKMRSSQAVKSVNFASTEDNQSFDLSIKDVTGTSSQEDIYNKVANVMVKTLLVNSQNPQGKTTATFTDMYLETLTELEDGFINSSGKYTISKIEVLGPQNAAINLDNLVVAASAKHISKEAMLALQTMGMTANPQVDQEAALKAIDTMLKSGLSFDIEAFDMAKLDLNMGQGMPPIEVKNFKFNLHAQLKENSLNLSSGNPMMYLPFVTLEGKIEIDSADLDKLVMINPMVGMLTGLKKVEGTQAVFAYAFKEGKITINGKPLPF